MLFNIKKDQGTKPTTLPPIPGSLGSFTFSRQDVVRAVNKLKRERRKRKARKIIDLLFHWGAKE